MSPFWRTVPLDLFLSAGFVLISGHHMLQLHYLVPKIPTVQSFIRGK